MAVRYSLDQFFVSEIKKIYLINKAQQIVDDTFLKFKDSLQQPSYTETW